MMFNHRRSGTNVHLNDIAHYIVFKWLAMNYELPFTRKDECYGKRQKETNNISITMRKLDVHR